MDLLLRKSSRWILYSFVDTNQALNLSEPLVKKNEANNKKGVVGKTGRITPKAPIPTNINPRIM